MNIKDTKVLLAESSAICSDLTQRYLNDMWIEKITVVNNGTQAVALAKQELYDLIIINTRLKELGGEDAATQINENLKEKAPKMICFTGDLIIKKKDAFDAVLMKPMIKDEFNQRVLEVLAGKSNKKTL